MSSLMRSYCAFFLMKHFPTFCFQIQVIKLYPKLHFFQALHLQNTVFYWFLHYIYPYRYTWTSKLQDMNSLEQKPPSKIVSPPDLPWPGFGQVPHIIKSYIHLNSTPGVSEQATVCICFPNLLKDMSKKVQTLTCKNCIRHQLQPL